MRKFLFGTLGSGVVVVAAFLAGPATSGALLLLLPAPQRPSAHDLPESYTPLHKGHVSLDIGRYIRHNEDLVVGGTPALFLRRTYISGYRASREFGIGTTHAGEWYLVGDGKQFQWAALVRPGLSRVQFERTSSGTSLFNAVYEHRASAGEWQGARLGWTGFAWALRQPDGSLSRFNPCGPDEKSVCSIVQYRDEDGHVVHYRRNRTGRLLRMETTGNRWIAFDYDAEGRITRAYASTKREVQYEYDDRGRLSRVTSGDGIVHRYTYTANDEMATIVEPGTDIENAYDANGRCIRQVNRFADGSEPYIFEFAYHLDGTSVVGTDTRRSDGTWTQYTFDKNGYTTSERQGEDDAEPANFVYERDPTTNAVVSLSLTCPDRNGRPLQHSSLVKPGQEQWIKADLVRTHCSWTDRSWRSAR